MFCIDADNTYDSVTFNYLALIAYGLNARSYLHNKPPREKYNITSFPNLFLQVPRPDFSFFHQTLMMMHLQLRFNLTHGIKIDTYKDQK